MCKRQTKSELVEWDYRTLWCQQTTEQNGGGSSTVQSPVWLSKTKDKIPCDWTTRRQCTKVAQLYIGHSLLLVAYLHHIRHQHTASSPHCNSATEASEHLVLQQCPAQNHARQQTWPNLQTSKDPRCQWSFPGRIRAVIPSGTHCPNTCRIWSVLWTVTGSCWRHFYFHSTSASSTLEVCYENALHKFTFDIDIW